MSDEQKETLSPDEVEKLRGLIESWDNVRIGVKVMSVLGHTIKWIGGIAAAVVAIWTLKDLR